jgi:hypothetical protein
MDLSLQKHQILLLRFRQDRSSSSLPKRKLAQLASSPYQLSNLKLQEKRRQHQHQRQ